MQLYNRCIKGIWEQAGNSKVKICYPGCEARWERDEAFRKRMINNNNFSKEDMRNFDIEGRKPKAEVKLMPWKVRAARFGDQSWMLRQEGHGGHDTLPTELYPQVRKEQDYKPPEARPKYQSSAASSSSSWQGYPPQSQTWQSPQWKRQTWSSSPPPWHEPEQWKRHKW